MAQTKYKAPFGSPGNDSEWLKKTTTIFKKKKHNGRRDFLDYLNYFCALFVACIVTCIAWHCLRVGGGRGEESVWEQ